MLLGSCFWSVVPYAGDLVWKRSVFYFSFSVCLLFDTDSCWSFCAPYACQVDDIPLHFVPKEVKGCQAGVPAGMLFSSLRKQARYQSSVVATAVVKSCICSPAPSGLQNTRWVSYAIIQTQLLSLSLWFRASKLIKWSENGNKCFLWLQCL